MSELRMDGCRSSSPGLPGRRDGIEEAHRPCARARRVGPGAGEHFVTVDPVLGELAAAALEPAFDDLRRDLRMELNPNAQVEGEPLDPGRRSTQGRGLRRGLEAVFVPLEPLPSEWQLGAPPGELVPP